MLDRRFRWVASAQTPYAVALRIAVATFLIGSLAFSLSMGLKELLAQLFGWCNSCTQGLELVLLIPAGLVWYSYLNIVILGSIALFHGIFTFVWLKTHAMDGGKS